jgi:hypothetical protein
MRKENFIAIRSRLSRQIQQTKQKIASGTMKNARYKLAEVDLSKLETELLKLLGNRKKLLQDYNKVSIDVLIKENQQINRDFDNQEQYTLKLEESKNEIKSIYE